MRKLLITFFGLGLMAFAPGTWGSIGAVVVWVGLWFLGQAVDAPWWALDAASGGLALLIGVCTVVLGPWAVREFGRSDPGQCVSDEAAGQWLALIGLPIGSMSDMFLVCGGQFILFRVFDILKPPPARQLERLRDGWGILLDDVAAAVYANVIGQIVFRWVIPTGA